MAEYNEVYSRARYYDVAFRRDLVPEVAFLRQMFAERIGRPLASMLDLACGPGYHARLFAAQGGRAYGLDLRPEMVAFAKSEAEAEDTPPIHWMAGDMRDFDLPEPVDLVLTSYDSIDCLLSADEIVDHFRCVARNLVPDGLYVFELTHPRDCSMWDYGTYLYSGKRDGIEVEIEWLVDEAAIDIEAQVSRPEVVMRVDDNGRRQEFRDTAQERFALPQEYAALARLSGALEPVAWLGAFRAGQPFDNSPGATRMIGVFQKTR